MVIWHTLAYNAWEATSKHYDLGGLDELLALTKQGKGLLLLGMHYGPRFTGYLLYRKGLHPAILAAGINIPAPDDAASGRLLPNEFLFRSAYDGIAQAKRSEKSFIRMMMNGRPGLIMNDENKRKNFVAVRCLGIDYPFATFPFKLALKHSFPVAVLWLSKLEGRGYKLNVREIHFGTVEEGAAQYGALLEQAVTADPFFWEFGLDYARSHSPAPAQRPP
jgi:lauroyl/myristoyl acyltransferase